MDGLHQESNEADQYQVHDALQEYLIHSREIRNPQIRLEDTPYANRGQRKEQDREHKENGENDEVRHPPWILRWQRLECRFGVRQGVAHSRGGPVSEALRAAGIEG